MQRSNSTARITSLVDNVMTQCVTSPLDLAVAILAIELSKLARRYCHRRLAKMSESILPHI